MKKMMIVMAMVVGLLVSCTPGGHISVFNGKMYSPYEIQFDPTADEDAKKDDVQWNDRSVDLRK